MGSFWNYWFIWTQWSLFFSSGLRTYIKNFTIFCQCNLSSFDIWTFFRILLFPYILEKSEWLLIYYHIFKVYFFTLIRVIIINKHCLIYLSTLKVTRIELWTKWWSCTLLDFLKILFFLKLFLLHSVIEWQNYQLFRFLVYGRRITISILIPFF